MKANYKKKNVKPLAGRILLGTIVGIFVFVSLTCLWAALVNQGEFSLKAGEKVTLITSLAAGFFSVAVGGRMEDKAGIMPVLITAGCWLFCLAAVSILLMNGIGRGAWVQYLMSVLGSALGVLVCLRPRKSHARRRGSR